MSYKKQFLEGSKAIALTIKNIKPAVVSAYPITPQTHIVEDLAKLKADGQANFEYLRAESEFAAASIVLGASATGVRVYSATSSQGLLLMTEVLFSMAGMRLPIVMTCANRAISSPINIWNDHQDIMVIRDSGWILLFAENHQEAVDQHILAYKLAEQLNLPVMVNVDGFLVTHAHETVYIPETKLIKKYLPDYKPQLGTYLNPQKPITLGAFATPADYMEICQELHEDLSKSLAIIEKEYQKYKKIIGYDYPQLKFKYRSQENGLIEYYGPRKPQAILVALGSIIGTLKEVADEYNNIGILKIKAYRPFPAQAINNILKTTNKIAILEKSLSLGSVGPLTADIKAHYEPTKPTKIKNYIVGLGGRDVTKKMVKKIINDIMDSRDKNQLKFINN